MRSKDMIIRLQRFRYEEKRRQVAEIESMIAEFQRKQDDLDQQVQMEEARTGVTDPNHFNYSLTAKAIRKRRDNLLKTAADLKEQLSEAKAGLQEAGSELQKSEAMVERGSGSPAASIIGRPMQPLPLRS